MYQFIEYFQPISSRNLCGYWMILMIGFIENKSASGGDWISSYQPGFTGIDETGVLAHIAQQCHIVFAGQIDGSGSRC